MVVDLSNVPLSELAAATANVDFGSHKAVNVADPTSNQDAATKKYHDDHKTSDAGEIISGIFSDARIPSGIARDTEVTANIATQTAIPGAHHTKYTDAEAKAAATTTKTRAYLGLDQTVGSGSWIIINVNGVDFDADSNYDIANYRYVVPETGYYMVIYALKWWNLPADTLIGAGVYENAFVLGDTMGNFSFPSGTGVISVGGADVFYLTAGRYVRLKGYQLSGSNQTVKYFNKASTFMVFQKLL